MIFGMTLTMGTPLTPQPTKRAFPTGGVMIPIHVLKIKMIPKCTGSSPSFMATGKKIGVKISTMGDISMKVPTMRRRTFMIRRITQGVSEMLKSPLETKLGISAIEKTQDMAELAVTRKRITLVVMTESEKIFPRWERFISR